MTPSMEDDDTQNHHFEKIKTPELFSCGENDAQNI